MKAVFLSTLLLTIGLCITIGFTRGSNRQHMSIPFDTRDSPEYGLTIVAPSDPSYNDLIVALARGNPDANVIETLRPYSIFIKNTSNRPVVACMLKWELVNANGKIKTETTGFIATWRLMSQSASGTGGSIINPNSTWFFPPSNIDVLQDIKNGMSISTDAGSELIRANYIKKLAASFEQYTSITVSLDGAFFDDGTFVGPNTTHFFAQVEALRNARRDLYSELKQGLEQGKPASEVFKQARNSAGIPKVQLSSTSTPSDLYSQAKKNVAEEILRMREKVGDQKTLEFVIRMPNTPRIELKNLSESKNKNATP